MKVRRSLLIITLGLTTVTGPVRASAQAAGADGRAAGNRTPAGWDAFVDLFREYVAADAIVGASALVMRDGRVLDRVDLGFADRSPDVPVDGETLFHWGSITKALTAISIMQLRDRGLLTLDDPVVDYIPELRRVHNPFGSMGDITIRMLLAHTAGFMNSTWPYDEGRDWEPFEPTTWDQLVAMMPYQRIHFAPGSRYGYSNPAFIYLARIVEQLTGDPWEQYVQKNIFAPLGLTRSYFRTTPYYLAPHRSHNYTVEGDTAASATRAVEGNTPAGTIRTVDHGADFDPGITVPNGGWNAPLSDLVRYTAFLTGAPPADGTTAPYDTVLKRSSLEEMWRPVQPMMEGYEAGDGQWMGLSFFIVGEGDARVLGHTGSQAGFRAFFFLSPRTRTGVIVAYNTTNYASPARELGAQVQRTAIELVR
jgi:CubicO group peptidase (beta-lactamase class C family)